MARRLWSAVRARGGWLPYALLAVVCTAYLNARTRLVPQWGEWYAGDIHPYILLQLRAWLSGHLALMPHPGGAANDYLWGRGGMHTAWGLGVPLLALPFHLVGRLFGAPGFPDDARFLILFGLTAIALARALHEAAPKEPSALMASLAAAGFVMLFPNFVGLIAARFLIYEQTIAVGALWDVLLLAGTVWLLRRCTPARLVLVCAAAGFAVMVRAPLAIYGLTTAALALAVAAKKGLPRRVLLAGVGAYVACSALYFIGNTLRFGGLLNPGYDNVIAGRFVNRMARWGLSFSTVPLKVAAKEMFANLFLLQPVNTQIMMGTPPEAVRPYVVGDRWREYYSPTFDLLTFALCMVTLVIVGWRVVRGRLWRMDRPLEDERATLIGAWALPPAIVLFGFYARVGTSVTRYSTDFYPAFAAVFLAVGIAVVDVARRRDPRFVASAQLALACLAALYVSGWRGWATGLSAPLDRASTMARVADIEGRSARTPPVPDHFACNAPRGPSPVHTHLEDWHGDCSFGSGMVFAMPHSPCVSFTFRAGAGAWGAEDDKALAGFRANADSDRLVACAHPVAEGSTRKVTMCDPHPPAYLLDGMRLYSIATLDENLNPDDRLKLDRIDAAPVCP